MTVILHDDNPVQIALKIFEDFELNQSCTITGHIVYEEERRVAFKGEVVLDELRKLDVYHNTDEGGKKPRRKRVVLPDTIGGWVAQKIFKYKKVVLDGETRISIWRIQ